MTRATQLEFLNHLRPGDVGLSYTPSKFAWAQNLYRKKMDEGPLRASHGFYLCSPEPHYSTPRVIEAKGLHVTMCDVQDILDPKTKIWIFRYTNLTPVEALLMDTYAKAALRSGGHYSVSGILEYVRSYFLGNREMRDRPGVFCTELTSNIITAGSLRYITDRDPWEISPSYQLNWLDEDAKSPMCSYATSTLLRWWTLAAHHEDGKFQIYQ